MSDTQKRSLVITAHPSSKGFTHQIAEAYKKGVESVGGSVEILDLYKTDLKQDFLRFESPKEIAPNPARTAIQEKITAADEIVFIHPLWWLGPPAILKNFLDQNISAHFAFRYVNGKLEGLLKGKTSCVFITCDGKRWLYTLMAMPFWSIWKFAVIEYCGMKLRAFKIMDKKTWAPQAKLDAFLRKACEVGKGI
jgi:NAD(P)H dehydrogenase (quinone)